MTELLWPAKWKEMQAVWRAMPPEAQDHYRAIAQRERCTIWRAVQEWPDRARAYAPADSHEGSQK